MKSWQTIKSQSVIEDLPWLKISVDHILLPNGKEIDNFYQIHLPKYAVIVAQLTGFKGKITWDTSKPDGQPRRILDTSKAEKEFWFKAKAGFEEGLKKTIEWYLSTK